MENQQFRIASALRLGARICHQHQCVCGKTVTEDGIHGLSCQKSKGRHSRHSSVNDLIKRSLVTGGISAIREPYGVSRKDGKRPDGMSQYPWKTGKCLLWDFTCGDSLAPSHVQQTANDPGKVASEAENRKIKHYEELQHDYHFTPICIETLGTWGHLGHALIKEIGKLIIDKTGEKRSTSYLFQVISMAVQRGNAISIIGTLKEEDALEEIYLI